MIQLWNKNAIVYQNVSYTYKQLLQISSLYASHFLSEKAPEKIIIFADNSPEWFFAFYGAMRSQSIVVPVDAQSSAAELAYVMKDCSPDAIFFSDNKREQVEKAVAMADNTSCRFITADDINLQAVDEVEVTPIEKGDPEKTIILLYTSGTTGTPKGVELSVKNVFFNVDAVSHDIQIYSKERNVMVLLPLHHIFPLLGTAVAPLHVGSTVYIAESLQGDKILKTLNDGKINLILGVPRLYDTLAKGIMSKINQSKITKLVYKFAEIVGSQSLSRFLFKSVHAKFGGHLDYLISGGAALSVETAQIYKTLGFYVLNGYGMTETAPMISFTQPGKRKVGYAGQPLKNTEVIIDENNEICVRGDHVMKGYYHREVETADIIRNGWLHTGDLGIIDKFGLKITGRLKEIIVTPNGKNINPEELELALLRQSPFIKEVGVYMHNSIIQAVILPRMTEIRDSAVDDMQEIIKQEIIKFNAATISYKRIKQFHITSDELPKTRLGKVQRFRLHEMATAHKKKSEEDDTVKSDVYLMLKSFVESETGMKAAANDHFEIDLSMDSLSRVALLALVENAFGVVINETELESLNTLQLLTDYIEKQDNTITKKGISWKDILTDKIHDVKLPKSGLVRWLSTFFSKWAVRITYRNKATGKANIPDGPCIIVANHRSALDGIMITAQMKPESVKNTFFFAKAKHWNGRWLQSFAKKNNVIIMDINHNLRESLQQMAAVLKKKKNIIIFPEGTRSKDAKLLKFKETFAILSKELNVPVVPVVIQGTERAMYKSVRLPRLFAPIKVDFLKPVYPKKNDVSSIRNRVFNAIRNKIENKK